MKNFKYSALIFLLVAGVVGFLFWRWWHVRILKPELPLPTPVATPAKSSLTTLLSHMRPLADDEKTLELKASATGVSGLVRYSISGNTITYTVFLLTDEEPKEDLFLWISTPMDTQLIGKFENGKGGLLISGEISKKLLPAVFKVAPKKGGQMGTIILSGSLE